MCSCDVGWQNNKGQTSAWCAVDHVISINYWLKKCGLEWFAQVKLCILWPHGASVSQWILSLNKWDEYMFQKMSWWMNMWHRSLSRPSVPMSMPTPQSLFARNLFNCHMTGWISLDSITVAESQMHWHFSHLDQIGVLHMWRSWIGSHRDWKGWRISCCSQRWTRTSTRASSGKELNECVFDYLGRGAMHVDCSLFHVSYDLYFVFNPAACPAGCIRTLSSIWRAEALDSKMMADDARNIIILW